MGAARRADGHANRLYLDPIFRGSYPEDVFDEYLSVTELPFRREGNLEKISPP